MRSSTATVALFCFALAVSLFSAAAQSRSNEVRPTAQVAASDLPKEAQHSLALIRKGGPFPFPRDGIVFGNRERLLPAKGRTYYHEYTVKTPGMHGRGARRIICGGDPTALSDCFYTDDHYQSFKRIHE